MKSFFPFVSSSLFLLVMSLHSAHLIAQDTTTYSWPQDWLGTWSGSMEIQSVNSDKRQYYPMKLEIAHTDTIDQWKWILTYGTGKQADVRSYVLIAQDSAYQHFILDEKNSILLDQYLIGNQFISRFHVNNSLLIMHVQHEGDHLVSLITYGSLEDTRISGEALADISEVVSYPIGGLQRAVLKRE